MHVQRFPLARTAAITCNQLDRGDLCKSNLVMPKLVRDSRGCAMKVTLGLCRRRVLSTAPSITAICANRFALTAVRVAV